MESLLTPSGTSTAAASESQSGPSISQPKIEIGDKSLANKVRAITSVDQIYQICNAMFDPQSSRNKINGIIAELANDSPPFPEAYMAQKGRKFRHNFCTRFFSGIVEPVVTAPVDVIDQAQYLTNASLPDKDDPGGTKTEAYRREATKLLRSWRGFRPHIYNIASEDVIYGYGASICDDPDDWRAEELRQDNFGVPDDTGQHPDKCQFFARRKSVLIHKFIKMIKEVGLNEDLRDASPWNFDNCIEAINQSMPQDRMSGSGGTSPQPSTRTFVDLIREGNSGAAYDPRARTIDIYELLAIESTGKVSKFIVLQSQTKLLYENFDEFEKLADIVSFYSLQTGNGNLYNSKGLGRMTGNIAKSQERGRNKAADNVYLGGLVWLLAAPGMTARLRVMDWGALIEGAATPQPKIFPVDTAGYDRMDERLTTYAQQAAGSYIPEKASAIKPGEKMTAHEAVINAQREQQQRAAWLKRFLGQFAEEVTMMLRRACDPTTSDEEAKEFQRKLIEDCGLTKENIKYLADCPAGDLVEDITAKHTQALLTALPWIKQSRNFDQYKYEHELSLRLFGPEITQRLMFPNGLDPADEAAQLNQQILEIGAIKSGESVNAVPTHNHMVHSKHIIGDLTNGEAEVDKKVADGSIHPAILDNIHALIQHGKAHVKYGIAQADADKKEDVKAEFEKHQQFYDAANKKLEGHIKTMQEHKQRRAQATPPQPAPGMPGASPAMPGAPSAPGLTPAGAGSEVPMYGGMTEGITKAWIAKYEILPPAEKSALEKLTGLGDGKSHMRSPAPTPPEEQIAA